MPRPSASSNVISTTPRSPLLAAALLLAGLLAACATPSPQDAARTAGGEAPASGARLLFSVEGLVGPEAVRYDPVLDVWFVSNFGESGEEQRDGNGFLSVVEPDGRIRTLRHMTGTSDAPLHLPRGMFVAGDTLWVADVDGVHLFHTESGRQLGFVDFSALEPGFLNDVTRGPDGTIYVTDTGGPVVYRIGAGGPEVAVRDERIGRPNGITWHPGIGRFLLAPWGGPSTILSWAPGGDVRPFAETSGGFIDGIEVVDGRVLAASQADSTLHLVDGAGDRVLFEVEGAPADIGVDPMRNRVAVPYIRLHRVDVWEYRLP